VIWWYCGACRAIPRDWGSAWPDCHHLELDRVDVAAVQHLLYNLAVAAALCQAFKLGESQFPIWDAPEHEVTDFERRVWRPGCGREAPPR